MNLKKFVNEFPDEEKCKKKFKKLRDQEGVNCPKCGFDDHYWLSTREQYKCKNCGHRIPLRSGTLLHATKLPFRYWFIAASLVYSSRKFSTAELQNVLGHKYYSPVWIMMDKIKKSLDYYTKNTKSNQITINKLLLMPPVKEKDLQPVEEIKIFSDGVLMEELEYQYFI